MVGHSEYAYVIDAYGRTRDLLDTDPGPATGATESSFAEMLAGTIKSVMARIVTAPDGPAVPVPVTAALAAHGPWPAASAGPAPSGTAPAPGRGHRRRRTVVPSPAGDVRADRRRDVGHHPDGPSRRPGQHLLAAALPAHLATPRGPTRSKPRPPPPTAGWSWPRPATLADRRRTALGRPHLYAAHSHRQRRPFVVGRAYHLGAYGPPGGSRRRRRRPRAGIDAAQDGTSVLATSGSLAGWRALTTQGALGGGVPGGPAGSGH